MYKNFNICIFRYAKNLYDEKHNMIIGFDMGGTRFVFILNSVFN